MLSNTRCAGRVVRAEIAATLMRVQTRERTTQVDYSVMSPTFVQSQTAAPSFSSTKDFSDIPGPVQWPLLGSYPTMHGHLHEMHKLFGQLADTYGPIYQLRLTGKRPIVVITHTDAIEQVFKQESSCPRRTFSTPLDWALEKTGLPSGIVFSTGEHWRRLRTAANKQIILSNVMKQLPLLNCTAEDFITLVERNSRDGQVDDVLPLLASWAVDGLSSMLFGTRMSSLSGPFMEESIDLSDTTVSLIRTLSAVLYSPPWYKYFPTKALKDFNTLLIKLHRLGGELKEKTLVQVEEDSRNGDQQVENVSMVSQWMATEGLDANDVQSLINDFLLAGTDNVSTAAMFLFHEIAKKPDVQNKLYSTITAALGKDEDITATNFHQLKYAKLCMKEIMRLYPVANVVRNSPNETTLLGYTIPKNTSVIVPSYAMGRSTTYFDEPDSFIPERWEEEEARKHSRFAYLPFGHGPRQCYGRRHGELEILTLLAKVVRNYELSTNQTTLSTTLRTTLAPNEPVQVRFSRRR